MSNVNIRRTVENIRANTTVYTPIVEVVVNAIQAIEDIGKAEGRIQILVHRSPQQEIYDGLPEVCSFEIRDNGIGFTDKHRDAFDTLYTDNRMGEGGKGFGRFICLKYFENVHVESVYRDNNGSKQRQFAMGKHHDIIVDEIVSESAERDEGTVVHLSNLKKGKTIDKKVETIARNLVEKLLPYFIAEDYTCPDIVLSEKDGRDPICLNDFVSNKLSPLIVEIPADNANFTLKGTDNDEQFSVRVFKIVYPKNQKSRISLVAHKREVSGSALHKYVPEFTDEFYEKDTRGEVDHDKNYIIKAYVFSPYLDRNVSLERGEFEIPMEKDLLQRRISQSEIEHRVSSIAKNAVGLEIRLRQEKKRERVQSYVDDQAPWHKSILEKIDLTEMPYTPTDEEIESRLQRAKFAQETQIKKDVDRLLTENKLESQKEVVSQIVSKISATGKNDLIHYIALRRNIIDILGKSLELDASGVYAAEGIVHDVIFPRKGDSDTTPFKEHNLWLIDERLNFTNYVSSDKSLNGPRSDRPDLLVYDRRIIFRGENEPSNPVTIFEFKKPQRDDFVDSSSREDPVEQIVRYVNDIREGK